MVDYLSIMPNHDDKSGGAEGLAALAVCESLLLALTELKVISRNEVCGLLEDVVNTHEQAAAASEFPERHQAIVESVQSILKGVRQSG